MAIQVFAEQDELSFSQFVVRSSVNRKKIYLISTVLNWIRNLLRGSVRGWIDIVGWFLIVNPKLSGGNK